MRIRIPSTGSSTFQIDRYVKPNLFGVRIWWLVLGALFRRRVEPRPATHAPSPSSRPRTVARSPRAIPTTSSGAPHLLYNLTGGIFEFFLTLLHLWPLRFLCVLGSNPGPLRPRHRQSDAITNRLDLIHKSARSHPHSARSHPRSARSHPLSARTHPHSARSHPHSARSHPLSARSHPLLYTLQLKFEPWWLSIHDYMLEDFLNFLFRKTGG